MHNKKIKLIGIVVLFIILGFAYIFWWNSNQTEDMVWVAKNSSSIETISDVTTSSICEIESSAIQTEPNKIYVYVCGYVNKPAVYELVAGARMFEAVDMAGGASDEGCTEYLDMAGILEDGERVYVPSYDEIKNSPELYKNVQAANEDVLVNINKATKEQLMTLPGIGESKADAIIQYREQKGAFAAIEDIMNIPGIKEAAFLKIKSLICV